MDYLLLDRGPGPAKLLIIREGCRIHTSWGGGGPDAAPQASKCAVCWRRACSFLTRPPRRRPFGEQRSCGHSGRADLRSAQPAQQAIHASKDERLGLRRDHEGAEVAVGVGNLV